MLRSRQINLPKDVRVAPDESPEEGLARLSRGRRELASGTGVKKWASMLRGKIEELSEGLSDARLVVADCDPMRPILMETEPRQSKTLLILESRGVSIAHADVFVRKVDGKVEAAVEQFQGVRDKEAISGFREDNGEHWNIFLVTTVRDAAYAAGFDRALLRDITTTEDYEKPSTVARPNRSPDEIRSDMKQLYTRTAKDCQFNVKRGNYYVREFP
jgi:hypothetical protein